MNIKDRFLDYINTNYEYEDYKYDLSSAEMFIYGVVSCIGIIFIFIVLLPILLFTMPLWGIPYLLWKSHKLKNSQTK